MATFHQPHEDGPGTFLQQKQFEQYWGADWPVRLAEFKQKVKDRQADFAAASKAAKASGTLHIGEGGFATVEFPGSSKLALAIFQAQKFLPYKPPSKFAIGLSKFAVTTIKGVVASGFAAGGAQVAQHAGTQLVGEQGMSFIDDIGHSFNQVSSLVSQGEQISHQIHNYGNAGSTGIGAPATPSYSGPATGVSSGPPAWIWIALAAGIAILVLKK